MAFKLTDEHITQRRREGFTVLRQIVPTSLIMDMRREVEKGVVKAREARGPQAQRFGVSAELDMDATPFEAFEQLPDLVDAMHALLGDDYTVTLNCILINPTLRPYCTKWHRDTQFMTNQEGFRGELADEFAQRVQWPGCMNQFNCPLYADGATWFVPGSQQRMNDTPGETAAADAHDSLFPEGIENRVSAAELERIDHGYCVGMPGAAQLLLEPGDFAVYRPHGWHIGNYVHYTQRATLHGWPSSPTEDQWRSDFQQRLASHASKP